MTNREITVFSDIEELSRATAKKFVEAARAKPETGYNFTVALAGGSTPKKLYKLLADENEPFRSAVDWGKIDFFWGDERCVSPESEESNFRTANENLLMPLGISSAKIHRLKGEINPETAATEYESLLRMIFNTSANDFPKFDLILLGIGADGHTASLFPETDVLSEAKKFVAAPFVNKFGTHRLTLTPPVLNNAENIIFQVAGADKSDALREVLEGEKNPTKFPAQIINLSEGNVFWFIDEAAAKSLTANRNYHTSAG